MIFKHLNFVNISRIIYQQLKMQLEFCSLYDWSFKIKWKFWRFQLILQKHILRKQGTPTLLIFPCVFWSCWKNLSRHKSFWSPFPSETITFNQQIKNRSKTWLLKSCIRSFKQVIIFRTRRMPHELPQQQFVASTTNHESTTSTILSMTKGLLSKFTN